MIHFVSCSSRKKKVEMKWIKSNGKVGVEISCQVDAECEKKVVLGFDGQHTSGGSSASDKGNLGRPRRKGL